MRYCTCTSTEGDGFYGSYEYGKLMKVYSAVLAIPVRTGTVLVLYLYKASFCIRDLSTLSLSIVTMTAMMVISMALAAMVIAVHGVDAQMNPMMGMPFMDAINKANFDAVKVLYY